MSTLSRISSVPCLGDLALIVSAIRETPAVQKNRPGIDATLVLSAAEWNVAPRRCRLRQSGHGSNLRGHLLQADHAGKGADFLLLIFAQLKQ